MAAGMMATGRAILLLLSMLPVAVCGQGLSDPTRPPPEIGDGSASLAQHAAPAAAKGLLSVIISPQRCAAIIDGKTIRLGEKHGDATLVEITARGVVLQNAHGYRSMQLFPGVGVKMTAAQSASQQAVMCRLENQKVVKKMPGQTGLREKK